MLLRMLSHVDPQLEMCSLHTDNHAVIGKGRIIKCLHTKHGSEILCIRMESRSR